MSLREHDTQSTILDYLATYRIFHYRNNTGAFTGEHNGKKRFVRFGAAGAPDIVAVVRGQFVGIEVKGPGKQQSPEQKEFEENLVSAGGRYILAHSLDDVIKGLEEK